jgi:hypothetical protein
MTDAEKIAKLQAKVAKQRNEIGRLTKQLEEVEATKRDHVFRLRQIIAGALGGHMGWRTKAERELGYTK